MNLIGLAGKKQSGKTTSAEYLQSVLPGVTVCFAFADPLKESVAALLGYPTVHIMEEQLGKENPIPSLRGITLRRIYQIIGTEAMRDRAYFDFWVDLLEERLDRYASKGVDTVIISDVRFENEAKMVRRRGGYILHLHREEPQSFRPWWLRWYSNDTHRSERGIKVRPEDFVIQNPMDMFELQDRLLGVLPLLHLKM